MISVAPSALTDIDVQATPCGVKGCDQTAAWLGDQHGCRQSYRCDHHKQRIVEGLNLDLAVQGHMLCGICRQIFLAIDEYVTITPSGIN